MYQTSQHYRIEGLRRTLNQTISYLRGVSLSDSRSSFFQFGKAATYFKYRQDLHVCLTIFCQNAAAVYGFAVYGQRYVVLLLKLEYLVIYYCQYRTHCQKSTHLRRVHTSSGTARRVHTQTFSESCYIKPNLYCGYTFQLDFTPNGIPFDAKSIGKV